MNYDNLYSMYVLHALNEGIVPMRSFGHHMSHRSSEEILADLKAMSPDEARKAKRKYRKMWRKLHQRGQSEQPPVHIRRMSVDNIILRKAMKTLYGRVVY